VDGVLQLILVMTAPRSDGLPGSASQSITDRCSKCWPLVPAEDPGPREDLNDGLEFHPPSMWDSLDSLSWGGGAAQVSQQILKPAGGDQSFSPKGLHLLSVSIHLLTVCVTQGRVLLIVFISVLDVIVHILLVLLSRCALGCWALRYH
jgi:hypothetical protein